MASGDTALWLHNKLGSTDDLWSGKTICSQLSQNRLQSIHACFHTLQPHVKVKLMLSFLHIPRRNVEQWKTDMEDILALATHDTDQWVSTIAEILQSYPSTGCLNLELDNSNSTFMEILTDLSKVVKKCASVRMLPMECQFLNKTALVAATGPLPQPVKHFALKRKPKSAILRAELLQKSSEVSSNRKNNAPNSVPYKVRSFAKKMDDSTPLKGLPGRNAPAAGFRSPGTGIGRSNSLQGTPLAGHRQNSLKKEGGIKLLELEALPLGPKEAKRRKKIQEMEEMEQRKKEKEAAAAAGVTATTASYTPDYAAGLVSPAPSKLATSTTVLPGVTTIALATPTPTPTVTYVPPAASRLTAPTPPTSFVSPVTATQQQARDNLQQQLEQQLGQSQIRTQTAIQSNQPQATLQTTIPKPSNQTLPQSQPAAAAAPQQKKGLSLTKEQMLEAQEMFRTSNKVTRPEKALILGFMAGSRDNPCPQQGSVLSIRLSENKEIIQQADGSTKSMLADSFFQMNYETGEWKRIKKYRECPET
ncbi:negative elongation factor A-like [Crassostrea virginica]|uniref:Negative elongation factor A-like n=1 Tax=Crassostrea virginica TaxID=6565 RepID=A0A8B8EYM3_CRAVI|nr:negative elongation factor A-like [Crassostrea virginica]